MSIHEISFPSANGRDAIKAWSYTPLGAPRAVVQLMHGFGEHSRRYLHMIDKFQQAGFAVYADDHLGHGKTGVDSGTLGDPHSGGYETYLKDEKALHDLAVEAHPGVPYFVFGHSWGSMLARGYAALYGEDLCGLLLCGVVSQFPGIEKEIKDPAFQAAYEADPYQGSGEWFGKVFCNMTDRYPQPCGPADWIANDPEVVADHAGDPFNGFDVTLELVYDMVQLYGFIENEAWAQSVPRKLPVYLIAGDNDPCGNYGEGLYHVANLLANAGHPVQVRAYSGWRHEIHNERRIRDEVEAGLVTFVDRCLAEK
ncbi:MAG: alpha/beta fold hydrolase [Clostridia bacterium]|nr:alpha/beta fold hydrolase [Clostridia bacterium]